MFGGFALFSTFISNFCFRREPPASGGSQELLEGDRKSFQHFRKLWNEQPRDVYAVRYTARWLAKGSNLSLLETLLIGLGKRVYGKITFVRRSFIGKIEWSLNNLFFNCSVKIRLNLYKQRCNFFAYYAFIFD